LNLTVLFLCFARFFPKQNAFSDTHSKIFSHGCNKKAAYPPSHVLFNGDDYSERLQDLESVVNKSNQKSHKMEELKPSF
jgi:hypothetical protein